MRHGNTWIRKGWLCAALVSGILALPAQAAVVSYIISPLGGTTWKYDYTIDNTAPGAAFDELTIYFDVATTHAMSASAAPADWDPLVIEPDSGIPADGFFDALSLTGPVAAGAVLGGFSVTFTYLGSGTPGAQRFELIHSSIFEIVQRDMTQLVGATVPEPSSLALVFAAFALLIGVARSASHPKSSLQPTQEC